MSKLVSVAFRAFFMVGLASLSPCAWADAAAPPIPQAILGRHLHLSSGDSWLLPLALAEYGGNRDAQTWEAEAKKTHVYNIPLDHTTPAFILGEMDDALTPEEGPTVLRRGEVVHCPFRIFGVRAIIPNPRSPSLLILANIEGFVLARDLIKNLDVPVKHVPKAPQRGKIRAGRLDGVALPLCDTAPPPAMASPETAPIEEDAHFYRLPLSHTTPDQILGELNGAYVPDDGELVLGPGKVLHNAFRMNGVKVIIPNRQDGSLLVGATPDGFLALRDLLNRLDAPPGNGLVRYPPVSHQPTPPKPAVRPHRSR